jgi:hypothetical protein
MVARQGVQGATSDEAKLADLLQHSTVPQQDPLRAKQREALGIIASLGDKLSKELVCVVEAILEGDKLKTARAYSTLRMLLKRGEQ